MQFRTRKIVMPAHLNGAQTLFGGQALAWIDEEAAVFAACQVKNSHVVTKLMSEINFMEPAHLGDIVEVGCSLVKFGRTSVTLSCVLRNKTTQQEIVSVPQIVFVVVNDQGQPIEHGITQLTEFD